MKKIKPALIAHAASKAAIRFSTLPLSRAGRAYVHALLTEELEPYAEKDWPHGKVRYFAPGWRPFRRAREGKKDTISWIDTFPDGAVFWDIGSNVGVYSLYAASKGTRTIAFEPEAASFYLLQKNIDLNDLNDKVTALNIALSDRTGMAGFRLADLAIGTPRHQVTDSLAASNDLPCRGIARMTGRDIAEVLSVPAPTHANIDVDGLELDVVRGLPLEHLTEIRCEMRPNGAAPEIESLLADAGFNTEGALALVDASPKVANFVFRR